jgi:hypothetical protein
MANVKLYHRNGFCCYDNGTKVHYIDPSQLGLEDLGTRIRITYDPLRDPIKTSEHNYNEVQDESGTAYGNTMDKVLKGVSGHTDVVINDQTTDIVIQPFMNRRGGTTLAISSTLYDKSITVTSATGMVLGDRLVLFDANSLRFSGFYILGISGNIITLDSPVDFAYPSGSFIDFGSTNMAVNGSVTPVVYGVRNPQGSPPDVDLSFDVTRIIVTCTTDSAVDLNKFGDLAPLTNGLLLRYKDGRTFNVFNVKRNAGFAAIGYDWTPYAATNPTQGQDGFCFRLTFGGQEKIGVVSRLDIGTDLEIVVQDDLLLLDELTVVAEGHIVDFK